MLDRFPLRTWPALTVDLVCVSGGAWWIYSVLCVYAGLSFTAYLWGGIIAVPAILALIWALFRTPEPAEPVPAPAPDASPRIPAVLAGLAALVFVAWFALGVPFVLAGLVAVVLLGIPAWRDRLQVPSFPAAHATPLDAAAMVVGILALATFVAWVHYPIWDDAYHVNALFATLENPGLALLSFDGMHGDTSVPIQQLIHRPQTHEIGVATLSWATGIDPRTMYWNVLPMGAVVVLCLSAWRALKALDARSAAFGLLLFLFLLVSWGDGTRTYGGYTIVRLFEGKAFFIAGLVPALLYAGGRFAAAPGVRTWAVLMLTQCFCAVFSSSALVLAPIAAGLVLLPFLQPNRRSLTVFGAGLLASAPLLAVILVMKLEVMGVGGLRSDGWIRDVNTMLGDTARAPLALILLTATPFVGTLLGRDRSTFLPRYAFFCMLLVCNEGTAMVLSRIAALFSWRLYWCVPMPLLVAGIVAMSARALWDRFPVLPARAAVVAAVLAFGAGFYVAGPHTYDRSNASWKFWAHRIDARDAQAAERVLELTEPTDVVLAPPRVAERIAQLPGRPRLISIREQYLINLARHWGEDESLRRMRLMMFSEGSIKNLRRIAKSDRDVQMLRAQLFPEVPDPALELENAVRDLEASDVRVLVVPAKFKDADGRDRLEPMGFRKVKGTPGFHFYVRDR